MTTTREPHLQCPRCLHLEWLSPEDQDTSLSEMHRHIRSRHYTADDMALLAQVTEVLA